METRSSAGLAALVRWYTAKRNACSAGGSPPISIWLRCHRSAQAASCSWTTLLQPSRLAARSFSEAIGPGSASCVSPLATAINRTRRTVWPGRVFQCQDHANGLSLAGAISVPSICNEEAAATAKRLPEYLVRQVPRSCSRCSVTSPRPSPSNDASRVSSIFPSSISKFTTWSPIARSRNDTRRSVRARTATVGWSASRPPVSNTPRRMSSVALREVTSERSWTSDSSVVMIRTCSQPGAARSLGIG